MPPKHIYRIDETRTVTGIREYFVRYTDTWETEHMHTRYRSAVQFIINMRYNSNNEPEYKIRWNPAWVKYNTVYCPRQITDFYQRRMNRQTTTTAQPTISQTTPKSSSSANQRTIFETFDTLFDLTTNLKKPSREHKDIATGTIQINPNDAPGDHPRQKEESTVSDNLKIIQAMRNAEGIYYALQNNGHPPVLIPSIMAKTTHPTLIIDYLENEFGNQMPMQT